LGVSKEFAMLMMQNNIPFTFGQSPGEHRPSYWSREVAQSIGIQYSVMERNVQFLRQKQARELKEALMAEVEAATKAAGGGEHEGHQHDPEKVRSVVIDP